MYARFNKSYMATLNLENNPPYSAFGRLECIPFMLSLLAKVFMSSFIEYSVCNVDGNIALALRCMEENMYYDKVETCILICAFAYQTNFS